jgi:hypothetical protein
MDQDCQSDSIGSKDVVTMSGVSDQQSAPIPTPDLLEATLKHEGEGAENFDGGLVSFAASVSKDKPSLDLSKGKSTIKGGKKKRKKILQKADAAGTTSDLYNAYKGPEEKKETVVSTDSTDLSKGGKFGQRKTTVKITHPDTHEELRQRSAAVQNGSHVQPQFHGKLIFSKRV